MLLGTQDVFLFHVRAQDKSSWGNTRLVLHTLVHKACNTSQHIFATLARVLAKFQTLSKERQGEAFTISTMLLWGFFPIVSILAYQHVTALFTAVTMTIISSVFFGLVMLARKRFAELSIRAAWRPILWTTFYIVVVTYTLLFFGYAHTTAGSGSIVALSQVLFSIIFFGLVLRTEKYTREALFGSLLMLVGAAIVLFQGSFSLEWGNWLILLAMITAPIGNYYQQQARRLISAETLLFVRSLLGSIFLLPFFFFFDSFEHQTNIAAAIPVLIIGGVLILGLAKIFWIESIHRISVAKAVSLENFSPFITLIAAFFILGEVPTWWQVAGFLPMLAGAWIILNKDFLHTKLAEVSE